MNGFNDGSTEERVEIVLQFHVNLHFEFRQSKGE
jgi:hypothetical protein